MARPHQRTVPFDLPGFALNPLTVGAFNAMYYRLHRDRDGALVDYERFFVRGLLELPIPELHDRFAYGMWCEVEMTDFQELMHRWHSDEQFAPVGCALANELDPYRATTGLRATLCATSADQLPRVELADSPHALVHDQRSGITVDRSDELAAVVQHAA